MVLIFLSCKCLFFRNIGNLKWSIGQYLIKGNDCFCKFIIIRHLLAAFLLEESDY